MTGYLVYSLQTEQRANVSTNIYVVQVIERSTCSAVEQTTDSSCESAPLPPSGWRPDWCCRALSFAIKNTKGIISAVQYPTSVPLTVANAFIGEIIKPEEANTYWSLALKRE